MSLINDALKRAKAAQTETPSPAGQQLRPIEPLLRPAGNGWALPLLGVVSIIAVVTVIWLWSQRGQPAAASSSETKPTEKAAVAVRLASAPQTPLPAGEKSSPPPELPKPAAPAPPPVAAPLAPSVAIATPTASPPAAPEHAPAAPGVPAETATPKPDPLKLQGIVFHPSRPAAIIGGKTLFIGDRVGEWRIMAIAQESATLVGSGQTNVLTLSQQ